MIDGSFIDVVGDKMKVTKDHYQVLKNPGSKVKVSVPRDNCQALIEDPDNTLL